MKLFFFAFVVAVHGDESNAASGINTLLSSLKLEGGKEGGIAQGRKMIIESMLSKALASETLLPAAQATLSNDVIPLLDLILTNLQNERIQSQADVGSLIPADYSACDPVGEQNVDTAMKTTADTWFGYVQGNFSTLSDASMDADCQAMRTLMNNMHTEASTLCTIPPQTSNDIPAWETLIDVQRFKFHNTDGTSMYERYVAQRDLCQASYDAYNDQDIKGDHAQDEYESAYCLWANFRLNRCHSIYLCNQRQRENYDDVHARHLAANTARLEDAESVSIVRCYIHALATTNVTDASVATLDAAPYNCGNFKGADYTGNYSITLPSRPADITCDSSEVLYGHDDGTGTQPNTTWPYGASWIDIWPQNHVCAFTTNYTAHAGTHWAWSSSDGAVP